MVCWWLIWPVGGVPAHTCLLHSMSRADTYAEAYARQQAAKAAAAGSPTARAVDDARAAVRAAHAALAQFEPEADEAVAAAAELAAATANLQRLRAQLAAETAAQDVGALQAAEFDAFCEMFHGLLDLRVVYERAVGALPRPVAPADLRAAAERAAAGTSAAPARPPTLDVAPARILDQPRPAPAAPAQPAQPAPILAFGSPAPDRRALALELDVASAPAVKRPADEPAAPAAGQPPAKRPRVAQEF